MHWHEVLPTVTPHVVRIETQQGHGTGFLLHREDRWFGIATARHVVAHACKWELALQIFHPPSSSRITLRPGSGCVILEDPNLDAAVILARNREECNAWPRAPLRLVPDDRFVFAGAPVGWLGFPHLVDGGNRCCFFSGHMSAKSEHRYFIDGVAINGVSGGPAFVVQREQHTNVPYILGTISEYWPNKAPGEPWPGVAVAEDVSGFHDLNRRILPLLQGDEGQE